MKSTVFWNITSCSPLKVIRCFGGNIASIFKDEQETSVKAGGNPTTCTLDNKFYIRVFIDNVLPSIQPCTQLSLRSIYNNLASCFERFDHHRTIIH
jgi:hypothetical protein